MSRHDRRVEDAVALYCDFSGQEPDHGDIVKVNAEDVCVVIGPVTYIGYEAERDGETEKYMHKFEKANSRPVLAINHDGTQAYILAGEYRFTDKGFED